MRLTHNSQTIECRSIKIRYLKKTGRADLVTFFCENAPSQNDGGETLLVDNRAIVNSMSSEQKSLLRSSIVRYSARKAKYFSGHHEMRYPPLLKHPITDEETIFIGVNDPSDPMLNYKSAFEGVDEVSNKLRMKWLSELLNNKSFQYEHRWLPGDIIILENFLVSHGRKEMRPHTSRKLHRYSLQVGTYSHVSVTTHESS